MATPSCKEYWDQFYDGGLGDVENYEWYLLYSDIKGFMLEHLQEKDRILHIGCGNSVLAEKMIEDADFAGISIINIDNCELIIEKMIERQQNNRLKANNGTTTSKKKNKSPGCNNNNSKGKKQIAVDKPMEEGSGVCEYMVMSVEDLKFEDNSFDCVLDKGCLDALLSTGQDEQGTNEVIQQMMRELFRVLKPNGKVFIFSKNDDFIVNPYFFFDESISWNVEMKSLERKAKRGDAGLEGCNAAMLAKSFYFYLLTAEKEKT